MPARRPRIRPENQPINVWEETATMEIAYLALGGNIGDVEASIIAALKALDRPPIIELTACSSIYRTEPVGGPPGQGDYLNAAARVRTALSPEELLAVCLETERHLGRVRAERWAPRTIDIDVLLYGSLVVDRPGVTIPHPRLRDRLFVLVPLADVAPASLPLPPDALTLGQALDRALAQQGTTREGYRRKIVASPPEFCN